LQFRVGIQRKEKIKILLNENCKKILPWTQYVKDQILKKYPEIKNKVEVVYPSIKKIKSNSKKHKEINLLFVGRYFLGKGGYEVIRCFDYLTKKYKSVSAIIVSEVPSEIIKKYSKNKKIKIYKLMLQKKLFKKIYSISDIFVYPGYSDTFGFSILEAMAFKMPVITLNGNSREELIENGKTGFILPIDFIEKARSTLPEREQNIIVEKLIKNTKKLIQNKKLREKMSKECLKTIKDGKFSIKERNKKLKRIYGEAIK